MYCRRCGKELPADARVCPWCGAALSSQNAAAGAALSPQNAAAGGGSEPSKKNGARTGLIRGLAVALVVCLVALAFTVGRLGASGTGREPSEPGSVISSSRPDDDDDDKNDDKTGSDASGENGGGASPASPAPADNPLPGDTPAAPADAAPAEPLEGFIFPDSDKELISQREIAGLSDSDLRYAINEIYARHGYIFRSKDLLEYYEQFDWYAPEVPADSFSSVKSFNQTEKQNWTRLVEERNARPAINAPESADWVYATLASSGDSSVEALVLRELAEDGKWSKYFDGKASDVWLKEYPTKSSRVRQQATIRTGREFELFITNNANAYRSRMGTVDESMTAYDMAVEEYYLSKFEKMHSELDWLGANPVLDSYVELINGNSWNVYSGYNSGKGTQDCIWFFFFVDETQEIMAEVSYEYVLYSGASSADEELFNEWYLNLSESLLIR